MASTSRPRGAMPAVAARAAAGGAASGVPDVAREAGSPADADLLQALELPRNGPRRFWLGFVFVDDARLALRARQLADELVHGRGREVEVQLAPDGDGAEATARALVRHARTDSTVWLDWSALGSSEEGKAAVDRSLTLLNAARTRLTRALRGGLVVVAPSWAEDACARGAVDLWSGREFVLRPCRAPSHPQLPGFAPTAAARGADLWRELAPTVILRALREEGPEAAGRQQDALVAASEPGDLRRLEVVAAGVALERGDRAGAAARARTVVEAGAVSADVLAAAMEIAAVAGRDASLGSWVPGAIDRLLATAGAGDPDALPALSGLAATLHALGDYAGAVLLRKRVLADFERVFGPEHPDTLIARGDLALSYWSAGRAGDAIELGERVLADSERVLGPEHPDTVAARDALVAWRQSPDRPTDATAHDLGSDG